MEGKLNLAHKQDTLLNIIETAMAEELKAKDFYKNAANKTNDKEARKLFEELSKMERAHVGQFKDEYRIITEPSLRWAEEDIPWMLEV